MKSYREKEMKYLLIFFVLLFLLWCTPLFEQNQVIVGMNYRNMLGVFEGVAISGLLSLITFLCDSIISSSMKDKLVGLFFIPRAGQTIFTRIKNKKVNDDRFVITEAINHYSEIISNIPPTKTERLCYENKQWYKIYIKHKKDGAITQTQSDYLLCRDLYVLTLEFFMMYACSLILFNGTVMISYRFTIVLLVIATITNISTHMKMHRFVNTVIAIDISKIDKMEGEK